MLLSDDIPPATQMPGKTQPISSTSQQVVVPSSQFSVNEQLMTQRIGTQKTAKVSQARPYFSQDCESVEQLETRTNRRQRQDNSGHSTQTKESHEDYGHARQNQKPLQVDPPIFANKHLVKSVKHRFIECYRAYKQDLETEKASRALYLATEGNTIVQYLITRLEKEFKEQQEMIETVDKEATSLEDQISRLIGTD